MAQESKVELDGAEVYEVSLYGIVSLNLDRIKTVFEAAAKTEDLKQIQDTIAAADSLVKYAKKEIEKAFNFVEKKLGCICLEKATFNNSKGIAGGTLVGVHVGSKKGEMCLVGWEALTK